MQRSDPICPKRLARRQCAEAFGIEEHRLVGHSRLQEVVVPRHATFYVLRHRFPQMSLPWIARFMGGRDHSTILHGIRRIEALMERDPELAGKIRALISCPIGDERYQDAHVRQWQAFRLACEKIAETKVETAPPPPPPLALGDELAEFVQADKVFCGQCDRAVAPREAERCKARLCGRRAVESGAQLQRAA